MLTAVQTQNLANRVLRARAVSIDLFGGLLVPLSDQEQYLSRWSAHVNPTNSGFARRAAVSHVCQPVVEALNALPAAGKVVTVLVPREYGEESEVRSILRQIGLKTPTAVVCAPTAVLYADALRKTQGRVPGLAPADVLHIGLSRARSAGFDVMVVPPFSALAGPFADSAGWDYGKSELGTFACAVGALACADRPYDYWPLLGATQAFWFALEAARLVRDMLPTAGLVRFGGPAAATLTLAADWLEPSAPQAIPEIGADPRHTGIRLYAGSDAGVAVLGKAGALREYPAALLRAPHLVEAMLDTPRLAGDPDSAAEAACGGLPGRGIQLGLLSVIQFLGGRPEWHALACSLAEPSAAGTRLARILENPTPLDAEAFWPVLHEPVPAARNFMSRLWGASQSAWPAGYRALAQSGVRK